MLRNNFLGKVASNKKKIKYSNYFYLGVNNVKQVPTGPHFFQILFSNKIKKKI